MSKQISFDVTDLEAMIALLLPLNVDFKIVRRPSYDNIILDYPEDREQEIFEFFKINYDDSLETAQEMVDLYLYDPDYPYPG